jgi:gamma-glutamyl-gamma-aminobutyrate hydrolase PuuD
VRTEPDSHVRGILGTEADVNSFHHQTVATLGAGLSPAAWAPDGALEAFEAPRRRFTVGVQWHAECLVDRPAQLALFESFVAAAAAASAPSVRLAS